MVIKRKQKGQGFVEYAILVFILILDVALVLKATGVTVRDLYCTSLEGIGINPNVCSSAYFHDDFNGSLKGWDAIFGNWHIEDGKLIGSGKGSMFVDIPAENYMISLKDVLLSKGDGYGVFFRADDYGSVDGYNFQFDPGYGDGEFLMREWANGAEFSPFDRKKPKKDFDWNAPHDIDVVVEGDKFTTYIDGTKVSSGKDKTYTEGGVGLRTWDSSEVSVGGITVSPIPDHYSGGK